MCVRNGNLMIALLCRFCVRFARSKLGVPNAFEIRVWNGTFEVLTRTAGSNLLA